MAKIDSIWNFDVTGEGDNKKINESDIESIEIYGTSRRCKDAVRRIREWKIQSWDLDQAFPGLL